MLVNTLQNTSALDEWGRAMDTRRPGQIPFLLESRDLLENLSRRSSTRGSEPEDIIGRAHALDLDAWLLARKRLAQRMAQGSGGDDLSRYMHEYGLAEESLEEGSDPHVSFSLFEPLARHRAGNVLLVILSVDAHWKGFAEFGWGSLGEHNPLPAEHCAVHRRWEALFGAQVLGFGQNALECRVAHPPKNMEDAIELAREHAAYCPSLLSHSFNSVEFLARSLMNTSSWSFRWD